MVTKRKKKAVKKVPKRGLMNILKDTMKENVKQDVTELFKTVLEDFKEDELCCGSCAQDAMFTNCDDAGYVDGPSDTSDISHLIDIHSNSLFDHLKKTAFSASGIKCISNTILDTINKEIDNWKGGR